MVGCRDNRVIQGRDENCGLIGYTSVNSSLRGMAPMLASSGKDPTRSNTDKREIEDVEVLKSTDEQGGHHRQEPQSTTVRGGRVPNPPRSFPTEG